MLPIFSIVQFEMTFQERSRYKGMTVQKMNLYPTADVALFSASLSAFSSSSWSSSGPCSLFSEAAETWMFSVCYSARVIIVIELNVSCYAFHDVIMLHIYHMLFHAGC